MLIYKLTATDTEILKICPLKEQKWYRIAGFVAVLNIVLALVGSVYLFYITFGSLLTAILVGLFWSAVFMNLQRFVFQTVSGRRISAGVFLSIFVKIAIIGFFTMVTVFPLHLLYEYRFVNHEIEIIKDEKQIEIEEELNLLYMADAIALNQKIDKLNTNIRDKKKLIDAQRKRHEESNDNLLKRTILENLETLNIEYENMYAANTKLINELKQEIGLLTQKKMDELNYFNTIISESTMIIERGKILLSKKELDFRVFLFSIFSLYCFPLLFKQIVSGKFKYDTDKLAMEKEFINNEFDSFSNRYKRWFNERYGVEMEYPYRGNLRRENS